MLCEKLANCARRVSLFACSFRASFEITTSRETHILIFSPSFLSEKSRRQRVAGEAQEAPKSENTTPRNRARTLQQKLSGKMLIRMIPMCPMRWIGGRERTSEGFPKGHTRI